MLGIGATGAGKTHTFAGSMLDIGIVQYFVEGLFKSLADKSTTEPIKYTLRMQYVEIINEDVIDLLSKGKGLLIAEADEWEGAVIKGAERKVIKNVQQFKDAYKTGMMNRTNLMNEFGRLSDKAAAVVIFDLIQVTETTYDTQVLTSKITFVECPGTEPLSENTEDLVAKQGPTLNQSLLALQDMAIDLSSGKMGDANYDASQLTRLLGDVLGGNTMTIAIFNFQCEDQNGSLTTLSLLRYCQRIVNFPIINNSKAICLLHKYRKTNIALRKRAYGPRGETIEKYQEIIAELEKKKVGGGLDTIKLNDERKLMNIKLNEFKERYSSILKEKASIQERLLEVENEKLQMSKALIAQQIENTKLKEKIQNIEYDNDTRYAHKEASIHILEKNKDETQKKIVDLQELLDQAIADKHDFELEFMSVKRNYLNKCKEFEELKKKNEGISVELISLMNEKKWTENKANSSKHTEDEIMKLHKKLSVLENENTKLKEQLSKTFTELKSGNSEKVKMEALIEQIKLDYDKKRIALEKKYVVLAKTRSDKVINKESFNEDIWENERKDLEDRIKELDRKLEAASLEVRDQKERSEELEIEKRRVETQLEEVIANCRDRIEGIKENEVNKELINTYITREKELIRDISLAKDLIAKLQTKCRILREYSRQLKYLCEDVFPENRMKPDILLGDEPFFITEESTEAEQVKDELKQQVERLKEDNKTLRKTINDLTIKVKQGEDSKVPEADMQRQILEELKMLKASPVASRPTSSKEDFETIRKERNRLLERIKQVSGTLIVDGVYRTSNRRKH